MERNEKEEVSAGTVSDNTVIPGGMPIGIYLETEGVMVLGTEKVTGTDGERLEPARHLVKAGDYIVECNGTKIRDKKELQTILKTTDGTDVILKLRRDSEYLEVKVKPVRSKKNNCMLGIWVRDNAQGLGTVTFLNSDSSKSEQDMGRFPGRCHQYHCHWLLSRFPDSPLRSQRYSG